MIEVHSLAFGPFPEIEPLNPDFFPGHSKLRITVDTEARASLPDQLLLERLVEAFPGLSRHQCRAQDGPPDDGATNAPIRLVEGDSSANQAHLLEHLTLELMTTLDRQVSRLSGVTCAYESPPQRNDIFVECSEPESGGFAALVAVETLNAALGGTKLDPLYPDVVRSLGTLRENGPHAWAPSRLSADADIPPERAAAALAVLERTGLVESQPFTVNFSGEPHYRFLGVVSHSTQ